MWESPRVARIVVLACAVGLVALVLVPKATPLAQLEYWTADWRTAFLSDTSDKEHPHLAVVVIDDKTLEPYPYLSPTDRGLVADLVSALKTAGAAVIGLDFYFVKATEPDKDAALLAALRPDASKVQIVLGVADERIRLNESQRAFQERYLAQIDRPKGYLNLKIEADGTIRYKPSAAGTPTVSLSFAQAIALAAGAPTTNESSRIAWLLAPKAKAPFAIVRAEDLAAAARNPSSQSNRELLSKIEGRIVLVGVDRPFLDQHVTPLRVRSGTKTAGILVHAQMVAELLDGRSVRELTVRQTQLLVLGMGLAGCVLSWLASHHGFNLGGWTLATILFVAIDVALFARWRFVLPFTMGMAAWVLGVTAGQFLSKSRRIAVRSRSPGSAP
jgi:adenylate cyclase